MCRLTSGERAAGIYTVIQSSKANDVDPQVYIADVFAKIANDWSVSRWNNLILWNSEAPVDQPTAQAA